MMRQIRFLMIRHGVTAWNLDGRIQGREDIPLSNEGYIQAACLSSYLFSHQESFKIEKIYASPLMRAYDSARVIADKLNLPLVVDDDLMEIDFGEISGVAWNEMSEEHGRILQDKIGDPFGIAYPKGEDYNDTIQRANRFIKRVVEEKNESVIVLSHAAMLRVISGLLLHKNHAEMMSISFYNCAITEILSKFNVVEYAQNGVSAFLSELLSQNVNHFLK